MLDETMRDKHLDAQSVSRDESMSYQKMLPVALSTVISASSDIAFVKDIELRYICCSPKLAELAGIGDAKAMVGKTDYDFIDKEYADRYYAVDKEIIASGKARLDFDEILPSRHDRTIYARTSKYPLLDDAGNVIGIYGVTRDITKYHTAYQRLELLTNSIPGGIATYEWSSGRLSISYFNDGFCKLFSLSREEYGKIAADDPLIGIYKEDLLMLKKQIGALIENGDAIDCTYRVRLRDGESKWINLRAAAPDWNGNRMRFHAVLFDVTEQQNAMQRLRISEEENRLAIQHSGSIICRYTVADRTAELLPEVAAAFSIPEKIYDVPYKPVKDGLIATKSAQTYIDFYESIIKGQKNGKAVYRERFRDGWRWMQACFSTIFSDDGKPLTAIISYTDVTEQIEKEAVYNKWQQSLREKDQNSYSLYRCNISKAPTFDSKVGALLQIKFTEGSFNFNERTDEYVEKYVFEEDKERFRAFLNSNTLLASYYHGKRSCMIEYQEKLPDGGLRWLRLSVDLVEYPNSNDVEAYLLYEDIDENKRKELRTRELAETDPLTGVLNRAAFAARTDQIIHSSKADAKHTLLMMDIDGFKLVNDAFGHEAGDRTLIDVANALRSVLRRDDIVGRLGGDEFVVFMNDIPSDAVAANKAKQICALMRKVYSLEVQTSGSVGIAMFPRDGSDFDTLYKKADSALYHVKGSGKDNYSFYHEKMEDERLALDHELSEAAGEPKANKKRRMLIVDDSRIDCMMLSNIFKNEFVIDKAKDGNAALIRLRHYGAAVSIVLLDLMMPVKDGFAVLEKMQSSAELRSIPVIVVSGAEDYETSLKAIKSGASDFITKPVDAALLRIRVQSAISRAENDRLRAQNSFLALQNDETVRYKTALECTGIVVVEYDCGEKRFIYDTLISNHFAGNYDKRALWEVFLSDGVTDEATVKAMQKLVNELEHDKKLNDGSMKLKLKTPLNEIRDFRLGVHKLSGEYRTENKLLLIFSSETN